MLTLQEPTEILVIYTVSWAKNIKQKTTTGVH